MAIRQLDIPLSSLSLSSWNVRKDLSAGEEDSGLKELASSIQDKGLLQPITVRPTRKDKYEVVVGQRRFKACQMIGYDPIPCLVHEDLNDDDALTISLIENVHRADMSPLDKASALHSLYERLGSYEKVALETSWSTQTVRRYLKLLELPDDIKERLGTSEGPANISALSRLAGMYSGDDASKVYKKISGFKQTVQEEILRRSAGDIDNIDGLVSEAVEGAFDLRRCGGRFGCEIVRDILEGEIQMRDFEILVKEVAHAAHTDVDDDILRDAAKRFWKSLATGEFQ